MPRLASIALFAAAGAAAFAGSAVPASAATSCKTQPGLIAKKNGAVLWTKGGSLYVCTAFYGDPAKTAKIGPWGKGSKYAFEGGNVLWTVRTNAGSDAGAEDRIYAADGPFGVWLKGVRLTTGPTSALDRSVKALKISGDAAGWVTTKGTVMAAVHTPDTGVPPEPIGAGTPGAAAPVVPGVTDVVPAPTSENVLSYPQGLSGPSVKPSGRRFLVGRWTALPNAAFAKTLSVKYGDGDGDECGGAGDYRITVQPVAGQPAVGADWSTSWTSNSLACR